MPNNYIQVPPDSTGKRLASLEHTVDALSVQAQLMHIASGSDIANTLDVDIRGAASVRFTEGQPILGGYGALKTATEGVLGVYESSLDSYDTLFTIEAANGGASTYNATQSCTVLSTTTAAGSSVTRTSNRYHYYLPGSSNTSKMSVMCGDAGKAGNKRRWGVYDDSDGLFFELNGTELRIGTRTSTPGFVYETYKTQAEWNGDRCDGSPGSTSGIILDVTKINNYWSDYQWNGAGRVRVGIYEPSGARLVLHTYENANAFGIPLVRTGTLPFRTENINTSATASSSELKEICLSMHTEGSNTDYTFWRFSDMEVYNKTVTTDTHMMSVKSAITVNGKHNAVQAYPETLNVSVIGGQLALHVFQSTEVTGGTWGITGASTLSGTSDGTVSTVGSQKFKTFFLAEGAHVIDMSKFFELNDEGIMCTAGGIPEVWSFIATKLSGATVTASINLGYRELW